MKRILSVLLGLALGFLGHAAAQDAVLYGPGPAGTPADDIRSAVGSGENAYFAALVGMDPATDPVMQRLKGQKIIGVRCYMRAAYKQKSQKRSYVMACQGTPDNVAAQQYVNFTEGWNEVMFDEPVVIGDDKTYVGLQVYETIGTPYPLCAYKPVSVPGGCFTNLGRKGWEESTGRGTLLIQAILAPEAAPLLERTAYAQITGFPLSLEPAKPFACQLYLKNHSGQPVTTAEIETLGKGDTTPHTLTVSLDTPLAPYDGRMIAADVVSGSEEGVAQDIALDVVSLDGQPAQPAMTGVSQLYVTSDVFVRIPVVEEFTGLRCPNCPFMAYYLDMAMEEYGAPHIYVSHHAGFQDDVLTKPCDKELIFLFGPEYGPDYKWAYNPAVMYDRTILPGTALPVYGASEASHEGYLASIRQAASIPALAQVLVDVERTADGQVSCRVHGRVHHDLATDESLRISTYLIEDGLGTDRYPQLGLDDIEGAPADLLERFKHNGVIRHVFNTDAAGDQLRPETDATFSIDYPAVAAAADWKWENCQVVALIHRIDRDNLAANAILNAGSNRLNDYVTGIAAPATAEAAVSITAGPDRRIRASVPGSRLEVYTLGGARIAAGTPCQPGLYVVRCTTPAGQTTSAKVLVR